LAIPQNMLHFVCVDGIIGKLETNVKGLWKLFTKKSLYDEIYRFISIIDAFKLVILLL